MTIPLALVGPTAVGKTEASVILAERLGAEIVVVDSMTVYRGLDVGTATPGPEERRRVPHHLLDVADPARPFSVAAFQALARDALLGIEGRGRAALLVGGSGLYYRAVVDGLTFPGTDPGTRASLEGEAATLGAAALHARLAAFDPRAAARIDPPNARRTVRALEVAAITGRPFSSFSEAWDSYPPDRVRAAGVAMAPDILGFRIEARADAMLEGGLLEEAEGLLGRGLGSFVTATQAIGYLEAVDVVQGRRSVDEAREHIVRRTRALARRQMSWFRRDPRIAWFEADERGAVSVLDSVDAFLRAGEVLPAACVSP